MNRIYTIFVIVLLASCCAQHKLPHHELPPPQTQKNLTLVTYNIGNFAKYMDDSSPLAAAALKNVKADAVGLNELDSCNRRHNVYQLKEFAAAMGGMEYKFAAAFDYSGGAYGNGIMTWDHIKSSDAITLPKGVGSEQRSVAVVETENYVLACTHLDHKSAEAQLEQARIINEWFTSAYSGSAKPVFLCGDMNALPDSDTIKLLEQCWTRISSTEFSFSTKNPSKCIDFIFYLKVAKSVTVNESRVLNGEEMVQVSDHFPSMVKVSWY